MRITIVIIVSILVAGFIYFFSNKSDVQVVEYEKKDAVNVQTNRVNIKLEKNENTHHEKNKIEVHEKLNNSVDEIAQLIHATHNEIVDCETNLNELLGDEENPISVEDLDEGQIFSLLDDFDQTQINVPSLGTLLEKLSTTSLTKDEDEQVSEDLVEIRPCKPFQKISFIHLLVKRFQFEKNNNSLRTRIKKTN